MQPGVVVGASCIVFLQRVTMLASVLVGKDKADRVSMLLQCVVGAANARLEFFPRRSYGDTPSRTHH